MNVDSEFHSIMEQKQQTEIKQNEWSQNIHQG